MKIILLGTSALTEACGEGLLDAGAEIAAVVSMPKDKAPLASINLAGFAKSAGAHYYEQEDINDRDLRGTLKGYEPDFIFSTWPRIIEREALSIPKRFVVGSHPTDLPKNRGRHPLHWLFVLGHTSSVMTLFKMEAGIDSGNILAKEPFELGFDIAEANRNMGNAARTAAARFVMRARRSPGLIGTPQVGNPNVWRKRTESDLRIDPRMTVKDICLLVRSYTHPYPGAFVMLEGEKVRVFFAERDTSFDDLDEQDFEHGRIIARDQKAVTFKAADGWVNLRAEVDLPEWLKPGMEVSR